MTIDPQSIVVRAAGLDDKVYAQEISDEIAESASKRGTGIAQRTPEYICERMDDGRAVIAITSQNKVAGFCYIETFGHQKYVANSGLIVFPEFRGLGIAKKLKKAAFDLSRERYPEAKLFGLTTSLPVMNINSDLGYRPVTFDRLTDDEKFWKGCESCVNYAILQSKERLNCLCTGMLFDPAKHKEPKP